MRWLGPALLLLGCVPSDDDTTGEPPGDAPTWHQDVAPILVPHCSACHDEEHVGPFSLVSYDDAKVLADLIGNTLATRQMPPYGLRREDNCDDRSYEQVEFLTEDEVDVVRAWARAEAPEGDPADAAPIPPVVDLTLTDANQELTPAAAVTATADQENWKCVIQDPGLTEPRWLEAAQVQPDLLRVLHNVAVYLAPPERADEFRALAGESGVIEDCFFMFGSSGLPLVDFWMPDALPMEFPADSALRVEPGSVFIQQVHAHGWVNGGSDHSVLKLRWRDDPPPRTAELRLIGNADGPPMLQPDPDGADESTFLVPVEPPRHREQMRWVVPDGEGPYRIFAVGARMNYAGEAIAVRIERDGEPASEIIEECLLDIGAWDLDWQRLYRLAGGEDAWPELSAGDAVVIDCQYWNRPEQGSDLRRILNNNDLDEPIPMTLGPGELDEQCAAVLGLLQ